MFYLLIASKVDAMEFLFNSSLVVESAAPEVGAGFSGGVGGGLAAQSCTTLAIPWTIALPGSSVHGISQVRILEWIAISFSRGSSRPRD